MISLPIKLIFHLFSTKVDGRILSMDQAILKLVTMFDGYGIALYTLITMAIAALLAFILGFERELKDGYAGLLQHILIAVSCALLMVISIWATRIADGTIDITGGGAVSEYRALNYDTSRIAAAVVSGIGFLGAGAIIKNGWTVKGLSSASTIWISSAIGIACGAGFILEAIIASGVTSVLLFLVPKIIAKAEQRFPTITLKYRKDIPILPRVYETSSSDEVAVRRVRTVKEEDDTITINIIFSLRTDKAFVYSIAAALKKEEDILEVIAKV